MLKRNYHCRRYLLLYGRIITMDNTKTVCCDGLDSFASADQVIGSCDYTNENRAVVECHTTPRKCVIPVVCVELGCAHAYS